MNNIELEEKILEILKIENYFDMVEAVQSFEKEYKQSDFFKKTKKPLKEMIREAKIYYTLQLKTVTAKLQETINNLDLNKISELLDDATGLFTKENEDVLAAAEMMKDLKA